MNIIAIVAMDLNQAIGYQNTIPWRYKADLQHFAKTTYGGLCIVGWTTLLTLPLKMFKDNRDYIVLSRQHTLDDLPDRLKGIKDRLTLCRTVDDALSTARTLSFDREVFVIGGMGVYESFAPYIDIVIASQIQTTVVAADAYWNWELFNHAEHLILSFTPDE